MKIIIIGGVAAGTSAAVRARRNSEDVEIVLYDQDVDIAHAGFATHYMVGGVVNGIDELTPKTPEWFKQRYNIDVHMEHKITRIDHENKKVYGINLSTGEEFQDNYDKLLFSNGSSVSMPPIFRDKDFSNVFTIKNVERARKLEKFVREERPKNVVVVGAGYIGLGVSEQLTNSGLNVTTLDFLEYPMVQLDREMSARIVDILEENNITFHGKDGVVELKSNGNKLEKVVTDQGFEYEADMFIVATGVKPNTHLAESIGVELGATRAIKVDEQTQTNIADVYAAGDVAEAFYATDKQPFYLPLATTANKMGRVAGDVMTGGDLKFKGALGTSAVRFFDQTIAATGLTESTARLSGIEPVVLMNTKPTVLKIMGGKDILIKAIADPKTEKLLGVQIIGPEGVERRIDVFATAITLGAKVSDLFNLDLAFTPPISTPKDPVMYTGMALTNAIEKTPLMTTEQLNELTADTEDYLILDVRTETEFNKSHIEDAINIPVDSLRSELDNLKDSQTIVVYSETGEKGYIAQEILINHNFEDIYNLSGGISNYKVLYSKNIIK